MKRNKQWRKGQSAQSKRTKLKRWGPLGLREYVESLPCCVCGQGVTDCAHVVPRSRGGGYEANLVPLCRAHHTLFDVKYHNDVIEFSKYMFNLGHDAFDCLDLSIKAKQVYADWEKRNA